MVNSHLPESDSGRRSAPIALRRRGKQQQSSASVLPNRRGNCSLSVAATAGVTSNTSRRLPPADDPTRAAPLLPVNRYLRASNINRSTSKDVVSVKARRRRWRYNVARYTLYSGRATKRRRFNRVVRRNCPFSAITDRPSNSR